MNSQDPYQIPGTSRSEPRQLAEHPDVEKRSQTALTVSRWAVNFAAVAACAAIVAGIIAYKQWKAADRQADIADRALRLTEQSAKDQAGDIERSRKAAENSASTARQLVEVNASMAATMQSQLEAATRQLTFDQRAWIGAYTISGPPEINKPFTVTMAFRNTGKTPAINVSPYLKYNFVAQGKSLDFQTEQRHNREIVSPNGEAQGVVPIGSGLFTQTDETRLRSQTVRLYLFGQVWYSDVFKRAHWLKFCYFLEPIASSYVYTACNEHNETDQNY